MKIYRGTDDIRERFTRPALTIGNFDGVHLGHQALFSRAVGLSHPRGGSAVAITFEPHPLRVLRPGNPPKLISTFEHKVELIELAGVDALICLPFTLQLAQTSAEAFVTTFLHRTIGIEDLVVGYDYALGRGREGDIAFLRRRGQELGFSVHVVPPVVVDGMVASSSLVRQLVSEGHMGKVRQLLGRYYQIRGIVQEGRHRGGPVVGFPTANLNISEDDLCPQHGVYVVQVIHEAATYGGVLNIGHNPTFGGEALSAEAHIFDFNKDIYGHPIKVDLIHKLRDEMRFSGPEELAAQIRRDIEAAETILRGKGDLGQCQKA